MIMLAALKRVINNCQSVSSGVRRGVNYGVNQFGFYLSQWRESDQKLDLVSVQSMEQHNRHLNTLSWNVSIIITASCLDYIGSAVDEWNVIMEHWWNDTDRRRWKFVHSVFCLTAGPKPPPKRCLHIVRSRASFKWEYPLLSLRSSSSFLHLLPRLLATSISPFIFPSITCFRRQFLRKMWPIQLAFLLLISCKIFLCSLTLSNTSSFLTWSVQLMFSILLQHHISKLSRYFWSAARIPVIL